MRRWFIREYRTAPGAKFSAALQLNNHVDASVHARKPRSATSAPGLGLAPATSAPGLGSPLRHLRRDLGSPPPHLRRDWAHPSHICAGTGPSRILRGCAPDAVPSRGPPPRSATGGRADECAASRRRCSHGKTRRSPARLGPRRATRTRSPVRHGTGPARHGLRVSGDARARRDVPCARTLTGTFYTPIGSRSYPLGGTLGTLISHVRVRRGRHFALPADFVLRA